MKFEQHWPRGFRVKLFEILHRETNFPRRRQVKCQRTTIFLATLVDRLSRMICAEIQPQGVLSSGEEDF